MVTTRVCNNVSKYSDYKYNFETHRTRDLGVII
jgi:hypothetical protein